jgi:hypothetical protein
VRDERLQSSFCGDGEVSCARMRPDPLPSDVRSRNLLLFCDALGEVDCALHERVRVRAPDSWEPRRSLDEGEVSCAGCEFVLPTRMRGRTIDLTVGWFFEQKTGEKAALALGR